ncbi:MAG: GNAT family N-acetyltransferase [Candidatus Thorarchaeota archaeon]|jgi:ribosomal protein S18 acetylase RimI-like enzyme
MKLKIRKMDEIDIDAHARLIYDARQNSPLRSDERTIDGLKTALKERVEQGESHIMIVAQDKESNELLGQLVVWLDWGEIGVSLPWQPIVRPESDQEVVAVALIEHSKLLLKSHPLTRLEIWMELTSEQVDAMSSIYVPWYEKSGFNLKAEEYFMDTQSSKLNELDHSIPNGIEVVSMADVANDELMDIVLRTFRSGSDKWVMSMTDSQLEGSAIAWLKRDETFDNDASIVFMDDGKIIGYNVMRNEEGSVEVGPIGVHPSHRGKGLGKALLLESVKRLKTKESQSVWLTVSTDNAYAFKLYSDLGFENKYQILIYSWMP